ncbi:MAG: hypothetical protein EU539_02645 [Promethearchaeota archaeon]|nr:MAG: hypothetical protein EU539_02645 [Candidatus Lokiarchaeota archaeon]
MEKEFARQRIVKDIENDDTKIQITGYVRDIDENSFILDDESGEIKVNLKIKEDEKKFKNGDLVNVIGNIVLKSSGEKTLDAQIIQDMNKLNFKYYKKLYELKKELD